MWDHNLWPSFRLYSTHLWVRSKVRPSILWSSFLSRLAWSISLFLINIPASINTLHNVNRNRDVTDFVLYPYSKPSNRQGRIMLFNARELHHSNTPLTTPFHLCFLEVGFLHSPNSNHSLVKGLRYYFFSRLCFKLPPAKTGDKTTELIALSWGLLLSESCITLPNVPSIILYRPATSS